LHVFNKDWLIVVAAFTAILDVDTESVVCTARDWYACLAVLTDAELDVAVVALQDVLDA